jgi:integrase
MSSAVKIDLPYVHTDRDSRSGAVRIYFRRRLGAPKVRLRAPVGSPEFLAEYKAALEAGESAATDQIKPRTYAWLIAQYVASSEFRALDARTQRVRRGILDSTCLEPTSLGAKETFADFPLNRFSSKAIRVLRERKADLPEAANGRVKAIRRMFAWAIEAEVVTNNPARDVSYKRRPTEGHHTWTEEELAKFEARHPMGTRARLAYALLVYTGVRRSDVVLLGRQHVRHGWLKFVAQKGRNRKPVTVEIPVIPPLKEALDAGPCGDLTFLVTEFNRPFTANGFGGWFRTRCDEAGLPQCSAHGLRKAGASLAAENGASVHELMAIFGWLTMKEAERYTQAARRRRLARNAGRLLVRHANETSPQNDARLPRGDESIEGEGES